MARDDSQPAVDRPEQRKLLVWLWIKDAGAELDLHGYKVVMTTPSYLSWLTLQNMLHSHLFPDSHSNSRT